MARGIWNPPTWLTWYGYAWAAAWGVPTPVPPYPTKARRQLRQLKKLDLDRELERLLVEERR